MATAGPFIIPDKAFLNFFNATNLLNPANSFKASYHTSTFVPSAATLEVFSDCTNELPTGGGYTAGGFVLPNDALTLASGAVKFTTDPVTLTASGSGIPAWRVLVVRAVGTLSGKVDPIVAYSVADADYTLTPAGSPLIFTPPAAGIIGLTKV